MQISPNSAIPAAYTASLPDDTTLYYVRAVLRDTATSAVLQTLNLVRVSATPNRYTGAFNPVSDPSGLGRAVDVTVSVYTDAGYTTLSPNYQILQTSYVVLQPFIANLGNGGGGSNVSYERIAETVLAVIAAEKGKGGENMSEEILQHLRDNGPESVDYERVENAIQDGIRVNGEGRSNDMQGIVGAVENLVSNTKKHIETEGAKHSETLVKMLGRIENLLLTFANDHRRMGADMRTEMTRNGMRLSDELRNLHTQSNDDFKNGISKDITDGFLKTVGEREVHVNMGGEKKQENTGYDIDKVVRHLLS